MKPTRTPSLSLFGLVESLQRRFEHSGLEPEAVDAAVIRRVGAMFARKSRNDERSAVLDLAALQGITPTWS